VSVLVDASAILLPESQRETCGRKWPFAVVTDSSGRPVPSQWTGLVIDEGASDVAQSQVAGGAEPHLSPATPAGTIHSLKVPADGRIAQVRVLW